MQQDHPGQELPLLRMGQGPAARGMMAAPLCCACSTGARRQPTQAGNVPGYWPMLSWQPRLTCPKANGAVDPSPHRLLTQPGCRLRVFNSEALEAATAWLSPGVSIGSGVENSRCHGGEDTEASPVTMAGCRRHRGLCPPSAMHWPYLWITVKRSSVVRDVMNTSSSSSAIESAVLSLAKLFSMPASAELPVGREEKAAMSCPVRAWGDPLSLG